MKKKFPKLNIFVSMSWQVKYTQIPMCSPAEMQAMQSQSDPQRPQGPFGYPKTTVGSPSPLVYVTHTTGTPQYKIQSFDTREKNIIQIKDPNSNKDVTQEILNRQPSWSLTSTAGSSSSSTSPDISLQSSSSGTLPLTRQQDAEAYVRAQFAAQVASALANDNDEKPRRPTDYSIVQKSPVIIKRQ